MKFKYFTMGIGASKQQQVESSSNVMALDETESEVSSVDRQDDGDKNEKVMEHHKNYLVRVQLLDINMPATLKALLF